jgi:hypothetical protein
MLIWETVIWDMLTRASTPDFPGGCRHGHGRLEGPGYEDRSVIGHAISVPSIDLPFRSTFSGVASFLVLFGPEEKSRPPGTYLHRAF